MDLKHYVPLALRTEKKFPTQIDRLVHAALGIDTETGELNTIIKRIAIYGKSVDDKDDKGVTLRAHAGEEIGDAAWYIAIGFDALGAGVSKIVEPVATPLALDMLALAVSSQAGGFADLVLMAKERKLTELNTNVVQHAANYLVGMVTLLCIASAALNLNFDELLDENIAKLKKRFADKYTDEAAEARLDKGGLDARNS